MLRTHLVRRLHLSSRLLHDALLPLPLEIDGCVRRALRSIEPSPGAADCLQPSASATRRRRGADYQTSVAVAAAKAWQRDVGETATRLAAALNESSANSAAAALPLRATPSSGGFVNFELGNAWLSRRVDDILSGERLHISDAAAPRRRVLVDFGSPNLGKELHVGHLRSAVIGDALANILEAQGAYVDRVSHVGDAGLPVAIVLDYFLRVTPPPAWSLTSWGDLVSGSGAIPLPTPAELSRAYEIGKQNLTAATRGPAPDATTAVPDGVASPPQPPIAPGATAHATLMRLQRLLAAPSAVQHRLLERQQQQYMSASSALEEEQQKHQPLTLDRGEAGADSHLLSMWMAVCEASRRGFAPLFQRLNVRVKEAGESTYARDVASTVHELMAAGVTTVSGGAIAIFVDGKDKPPLLLRKADGCFLYATIDMAALRSRLRAGYSRIVYVTDESQSGHFRQVFAAARLAGWIDDAGCNTLAPGLPSVSLEHAPFGVVTVEGGASNKKMSSRDGGAQSLARLLDAGVAAVRASLESGAFRHATAPISAASSSTSRALRGTGSTPSTTIADGASAAGGGSSSSSEIVDADSIAEAIACSSIRYFDLSHGRRTNYAFSFDRMLQLKGNTAAYIMYAVARLGALRSQADFALRHMQAASSRALLRDEIISGATDFGYVVASSTPTIGSFIIAPSSDTRHHLRSIASVSPPPVAPWDCWSADWRRLADTFGALHTPPALTSILDQPGDGAASISTAVATASSDAGVSAAVADVPGAIRATGGPLSHPAERQLALTLIRFPEALDTSAGQLQPHLMAEYLFSLAGDFHAFYGACRVTPLRWGVAAPSDDVSLVAPADGARVRSATPSSDGRASNSATPPSVANAVATQSECATAAERLRLCGAAESVLRRGCHLLGVNILARM